MESFHKLASPHQPIRAAVISYMVGIRVYDNAVGILLDYLENTIDTGFGDGTKRLIETTALIFYTDHFNYTVYRFPRQNITGGGLLSSNTQGFEGPIGEKITFMMYNPKDYWAIASPVGRRIETFMANNDIYKTVAHLFDIETHDNFTLGASILSRHCFVNNIDLIWLCDADDCERHHFKGKQHYRISVGIGLYNGLFYGTCLSDPNKHFTTRDFRTFRGANPNRVSREAYLDRMEDYADTLIKLRSYYDANRFRHDHRARYTMGQRPIR